MEKVNLAEKFSRFQDVWSPKIAGEVNDSYIKLVKVKGEFIWHQHETEDELFFVVKGKLLIKLPDREIHLQEGEFVVIPRGGAASSYSRRRDASALAGAENNAQHRQRAQCENRYQRGMGLMLDSHGVHMDCAQNSVGEGDAR